MSFSRHPLSSESFARDLDEGARQAPRTAGQAVTPEARLAQLEGRVDQMSRSLEQLNARAASIEGSFKELLTIIETYMNEAGASAGVRERDARPLSSWLQRLAVALLLVIIGAVAWATIGSSRSSRTAQPAAPSAVERPLGR